MKELYETPEYVFLQFAACELLTAEESIDFPDPDDDTGEDPF